VRRRTFLADGPSQKWGRAYCLAVPTTALPIYVYWPPCRFSVLGHRRWFHFKSGWYSEAARTCWCVATTNSPERRIRSKPIQLSRWARTDGALLDVHTDAECSAHAEIAAWPDKL